MIFGVILGMALMQAPSTPLVGTVVAEDGTPVVGAELVLAGPKGGASPVVARGKTGEGGRFQFDRPAGLAPTNQWLVPTLWVAADGHRVTVRRFAEGLPGPEEPVRVVLRPAVRTKIRVEAPDGTPLAGAKVNVQRIKSEPLSLPEPISDLTERTTGPDGVAVLDSFGPEEVGSVDVIAEGFGIQPRWLAPEKPGPKEVRLLPVVTFRGRLVPIEADPQLARGWRVRAWTHTVVDPRGRTEMAGYGSSRTDDAGRFTIPEIAPGSLQLSLIPPDEASDLLPELKSNYTIQAGRENAVEVPLRRPSTITGLVRERGTEEPVAGAEVSLTQIGGRNHDYATTDERGRYTLRGLPGKVRFWLLRPPPTHVQAPGQQGEELTLPDAPARIALEPREVLRAAPPLRGLVRDEAGQPVAGAAVRAEWRTATPRGGIAGSIMTATDKQGQFRLLGLGPNAQVTIAARLRDRATAEPVTANAGGEGSVVVTIVPTATVAVAGRVLGPGGVPVEGAEVKLRYRELDGNQSNRFGRAITLEGNARIWTAPDGTFRTPKELDREGRSYQAEVVADGFHPGKSAWVPTGPGDVVALPEVRLQRALTIRVVSGRVVDREGRPVAGALVFQSGDGPSRTEATADDAGRFRLPGVYAGPALVFAEQDGFRFGGAVVRAGDEAVEVRLAREVEAPAARLETLPSPMGRDEERALARDLIAPVLPVARLGVLSSEGSRVMPALARVDPERALRLLEDRVPGDPSAVLHQIALARFEDDPGAGIAMIEADLDAGSRAWGFLGLADAVPDDALDRGAELLDRALAEARRATGAGTKLTLFQRIADRWLDLGDLDRATPILREGQAVIEASPRATYLHQAAPFGESLAVIDLPAAQALFQGERWTRAGRPSEDSVRYHLGAAAVRVASFDPTEAERLAELGSAGPNPGDRQTLLFRVGRAMGRADLPRARKLLARSTERPDAPTFARPGRAPYGLGLIASDLAATDPATARTLLDEAFAGLLATARDHRYDGSSPPASIAMAVLLPTVERVDPDHLAERLWRAASCRTPRAQEPQSADLRNLATLALLVSRYDRAMADAIAAPVLDRLPASIAEAARRGAFETQPSVQTTHDTRVFEILAAYDPRAIVQLIRSLPDPVRKAEEPEDRRVVVSPEIYARLSAALVLGQPIEKRRRQGLERSGLVHDMLPSRP